MNNESGNPDHSTPPQAPYGAPAQMPSNPYGPHQPHGPQNQGFGGPLPPPGMPHVGVPGQPGPYGPYGPYGPQGPGQPFAGGPMGPGGSGKGPEREWFQKKRWWAVGTVVGLFVLGAAVGGGESDETTTAGDDRAQVEDRAGEPRSERKNDRRNGSRDVEAVEDDAAQSAEEAEPATDPEPEPEPAAVTVDAATLLEAFEGNEAAADAEYKGKTLEVTGNVYKVDTEFWDEDQYVVMLDNGEAFSFLTVNCNDVSADQAARVQTGSQLTVRGDFEDGGDLGIELVGCEVL